MYLLYADDSGVASDPNVKYSVLAGFAKEKRDAILKDSLEYIKANYPHQFKFCRSSIVFRFRNVSFITSCRFNRFCIV